jgi:DNA-binding IclR family transcriptional regulator
LFAAEESMPELLPEFDSESLQILALLARSDAYWTGKAISQQLGIPEDVVSTKLVALSAARILVRGKETGAYRFAPASDHLDRLRAFSDAFRLKNE